MKLKSLIIILLISTISVHAQNDSVPYSFFVAGHTYGQPGVNNVGFHPPFKQKFPYIQSRPEIDFGVLTGDIVSPFPISQDWDEIDAEIDTLGLPVYFAVGNHDMENRPLFEARYGITYFDFIYNNDLFIILDPNIDGWSITGDQLLFLQNSVSDNYTVIENVFVFFHQILWRENTNQFNYISWNSGSGRINPVNFWSTVIPIFDSIPNDVHMFAGDLGASWSTDVTFDRYNNIKLIASGMGDQNGENIIVVNVDSNKSVNYDLICLSDTNISCLGELTDYLTVDSVTSINELSLSNNIISTIYPNPANQYFIVSTNQKRNLKLFDMKGVLVLEVVCNGLSDQKINASNLHKGIYISQLSSEKGIKIQKIILQ
jgi:hypothetical protein